MLLLLGALGIGIIVLLAFAPAGAPHIRVAAAADRHAATRRTVGGRARRVGLGAFFGSVVVNAAIGIYGVLMPHFGDTAVKVLVTSLCITGAMLMTLCCEPAWERRLLWHVPAVGAALGAAAFAGLIVGIWTDPASEVLAKLLASTFVLAIACTLASVVALERARIRISRAHERVLTLALGLIALAAVVAVGLIWTTPSGETIGKFVATGAVAAAACVLATLLTLRSWKGVSLAHERILTVTLGVIALAAAVAVALIWIQPSGDTAGKFAGTGAVAGAACVLAGFLTLARLSPAHRWALTATLALLALGVALVVANIWLSEIWVLVRVMGVVLIAFAAFAVSVPVLHWIDRDAVAAAAATEDSIRYCPHCGRKLAGEIGAELTCGRCGRGFSVSRIEANLT